MDVRPFSTAQEDVQDMNWDMDLSTLEQSMTENATSSAASHPTELSTMQPWGGHNTKLKFRGLGGAATDLETDEARGILVESNGLDSPEPMVVNMERQSSSNDFDLFSQVDRHAERHKRLRNVGDRLHAFSELRRASGAAAAFPPARWYLSSLKSPQAMRNTPGVYPSRIDSFFF